MAFLKNYAKQGNAARIDRLRTVAPKLAGRLTDFYRKAGLLPDGYGQDAAAQGAAPASGGLGSAPLPSALQRQSGNTSKVLLGQ